MDNQAVLIAEIDADGGIGWLWCVDHGKRPKLVKDMAVCLQDLDMFTVYGAPKSEIRAWLCGQVHSA